jgi:AcrR family transcriptional regulator
MAAPTNHAPRTRNARGDGGRLGDEIVAAATRLLERLPEGSITLRAIAREAGITAPSIYRHFDSVGAILRAVIEVTFADLEVVLREPPPHGNAAERLEATCHRYLLFAQEHPEQYRLLFGGAWNASALPSEEAAERAERAEIGQDAFRVLVGRLDECITEGMSLSENSFADSAALWVGLHGLASLRRTAPLFPWPSELEHELIRSLARLE